MTSPTRSRLSPEQRRDQLLDLGVRLLATRSLDELSIDLLAEEAGISRGLLYHYFGSKQAFREAVVRRAADELVAATAPPALDDPVERLLVSVTAYVDYVLANFEGYVSLIRGAQGGNVALREIYEEVRRELGDRVFRFDPDQELVTDSPQARLIVRGWLAYCEELVVAWGTEHRGERGDRGERAGGDGRRDRGGVSRAELDALVAGALPGLLAAIPAPQER